MYQNIRGLRTNLEFFRNCVINLNCDLLFLFETWLNNDFNDVVLGLVDFNLFRIDKFSNVCVRGGGVLLATRKSLNCKLLNFDPIQGVDKCL